MAKPSSKQLLRKLYPGNILDRMADGETAGRFEASRPVHADALSDISNDLGRMTAGEFVAAATGADASDVTNAGFTGSFVSGDPKTFSSGDYNVGAVKAGNLAAGFNTEGNLSAGNGSIVINETGIDIGPGLALLSANGVWGIGGNILLDTTNFNKRLSLTGSGGYSNLATGANGTIYCIAKDSGGNIYAGGTFTQIGGITAYGIAMWNGSSWSAMSPGFNGTVYSIVAVSPTEVYAGGVFTKTYAAGGDVPVDATPDLVPSGGGGTGAIALNRLAAWDGSAWSPLGTGVGTGANGTVRAMAITGSTLYVTGEFTTCLGTTAARIASINTGTEVASALAAGLNNTCYGIALSGADVYVVGAFTGTPAYVGLFSGGTWSTPGASPPAAVTYAIAISGTDVYIGGNWAGYVKLSAAGGAWGTVGASGPDSAVRSLAIDGTNIIAGYSGSPYVKYYNGAAWVGLGDGLNGIPYALLVDTTWLIGGAYTTADGGIMYRISRYSTSTAPTTLSLQTAMDMLDEHSHYTAIPFRIDGTVGVGVTGYGGASGNQLYTTAANAASALPAGTVRSIGIYMSTAMGGTTGQIDVTLFKNGSATGITFQIPDGTAAGVQSSLTTTTVTFAAGDYWAVEFDNNADAASGSLRAGYIEFAPS